MEKRSPHLISCNDLFANFDMKKLTGKGNIKRAHKCADKKALAKQIFLRYLYIMFTDFIQGGKTFLLPGRFYLELRMRRIPAQQFKHARQVGAYADLDIIASEQKAYEPVLCYRLRGRLIETNVVLSSQFKQAMIEKMNTGYKYC